jgi:hypothetical protein
MSSKKHLEVSGTKSVKCEVRIGAGKRTRSKWSRVMRYAAVHKPDAEPLNRFIRRKGGINACAARFSRRLGRGAAKRSERRSARG